MICHRCNKQCSSYKMSMFNTELCCMVCIKIEKMHPSYQKAVKEELLHCKNKNFNFKGIGLPNNFEKFSKKNMKFAKKELNRYLF